MSDPITAEQAAILLADATPGPWEVAEVRDGAQGPGTQELTVCVNADPRSYQKPDGTWHSVFVCRGMDGPTREANAALLAAAPDLARTVILRESEVSALRDVLAQTERERDALLREKRWRECWEHLHGSSADLDTKSAARRETQRIALRGYGQLLRAVRSAVLVEGRYVTMLDAARAIGCSVPTLSDVERSKAPPFDDATTRKLCAYLGCDPAPLLAAAARCEGVLR